MRVFISYRRADTGAIAGRLYDRLQAHFGRGSVFIDTDDIPSGVDFRDHLKAEVHRCEVFLALVGKGWMGGDDKNSPPRLRDPADFVRIELEAALARDIRVIPVLVGGAAMPLESELPETLAEFAYRNALVLDTGRDFNHHVERLATEIAPDLRVKQSVTRGEGAALRGDERSRRALLEDVRSEVTDRLRQSLHHAAPIPLAMETQPKHVTRPWDADVKIVHQEATLLPEGTTVLSVFDGETIRGRLLILGAPGAGKTTTVLQLAYELSKRAIADADSAAPVLINLATWKNEQPISRWLLAELKSKYGVRADVSERWLNEASLLPLLDGLDEVAVEHQQACVQAINQFQQDRQLAPVVVCCRVGDYENLDVKLRLNEALLIRELRDEQVESYLRCAGHGDLWSRIERNAGLLQLSRSPLFLRMMVVTGGEGSEDMVPLDSPGNLFAVYIQRALSSEGEKSRYSVPRTMFWLSHLAQHLKAQGKVDFVIEQLQPDVLSQPGDRWTYRCAVMLMVALGFLLFMFIPDPSTKLMPSAPLLERFVRGAYPDQAIWLVLTGIGLVTGLVVALLPRIHPIESLRWSPWGLWKGLGRPLLHWCGWGTYVGFAIGMLAFLYSFLRPLSNARDPSLLLPGRPDMYLGAFCAIVAGVAALRLLSSQEWKWSTLISRRKAALIDGIASSLIVEGCALGGGNTIVVATSAAVTIGAVAALAYGSAQLARLGVAGALLAGVAAGLISGVAGFAGGTLFPGIPPVHWAWGWQIAWLQGWMGLATLAGIAGWRLAQRSGVKKGAVDDSSPPRSGTCRRVALYGVAAGVSGALVVATVIGLHQLHVFKAIAFVSFALGLGMVTMAASVLFCTLSIVIGVVVPWASLLFLLGKALAGPDIERRLRPNQGIRKSAMNTAFFALIGALVLAPILGTFNLLGVSLFARVPPTIGDWWAYVLVPAAPIAFLTALLPGAACIQHLCLRLVLWYRGLAPLDYPDFLNYCTSRLLLQRFGGRYRFMHELLRDHLAATPRASTG